MWNIFNKTGKNSKEETKQAILKEFFSPAEQKKAVTRAVRESAKDQRMLVEKYHRLKLNKDCH